MRKNIKLFDYNADASAYITNLYALAQERTWLEPSDEFFKDELWEDYVDSVVEDGLQVGQPGYSTNLWEEHVLRA